MRPDFIEQLQNRLVELGCPRKRMRRLVQEVVDHHEDLKQAALSEGLSEVDAENQVNAKLGDPLYLAEHQMVLLRRSSWWGRHSLVSFCFLPLLAVPILWVLLLLFSLSVEFALGYGWDEEKLHLAADDPVKFHYLVTALHYADFVAIALVTLLFCWLARRSAVGFTWMVVSCGVCSLYASLIWIHVAPHNFTLGITFHPQWMRAAIPLLIAGAIYVLFRRTPWISREKMAVASHSNY